MITSRRIFSLHLTYKKIENLYFHKNTYHAKGKIKLNYIMLRLKLKLVDLANYPCKLENNQTKEQKENENQNFN